MADYPKTYEKNGKTKTASNRRQEVQLRFDGFREVAGDSKTSAPEPSLSGDSAVPTGDAGASGVQSNSTDAPELSEAEMAKLPEAKGAEIVDLTNTAKPGSKPRSN